MKQYITATDVMNYLYDPRSIYLMHVLKIPQEVTVKMDEGKKTHLVYSDHSKRNKIIKELPRLDKNYDVYLSSDELNCATRIDCILTDLKHGKAYPVEFKHSRTPKKLYDRHVYQLVLEALLIEDYYGYKVTHGYIKFLLGDNLKKINITKQLKKNLLTIIEDIQNIIQKEKCPNIKGLHPRLKDYGYKNVI